MTAQVLGVDRPASARLKSPPAPCPPQVRGPIVVQQYYKMAEQPAADPASRWFPTGDVASIDARGIMRITDRCARAGRPWHAMAAPLAAATMLLLGAPRRAGRAGPRALLLRCCTNRHL
jgi:acyl-CoA synthetase (AMP-forming)/AMP-acid ligase II